MAGVDVLIAVEDPGAANFIVELPLALKKADISCSVLACGHACGFLHDRKVAFHELSFGEMSPLDIFLPRLLLAGSSQNFDSLVLKLLEEARRRNIQTAGFVDMAVDASLRFKGRTENPLAYAPEYLFVPDRTTQKAFEDLGFSTERIIVCGHPAYDRVRRRARELARQDMKEFRIKTLKIDPSPRPVWLFAAEHADGCEYERMHRGPGYTLHGRGKSDRRTDIVLEEVLDLSKTMRLRPFLILRLHPKNTPEEFFAYLSEVDFLSAEGDPLDLIWASDLVIGLSSILLMEAAFMDRPTLAVVPREEERFWSPSVARGITPCVNTRLALSEIITKSELYVASEIPRKTEENSVSALCEAVTNLLIGSPVSPVSLT